MALGLIVLASGVLASSMLDRGHNWGDDFASYIMQAQSLIRGNTDEFVLRNTFTISQSSAQIGLTSYPWGFPLLLSPVYAVFGTKILAFKLVLTLCYMAFLIAFFILARTRCSELESLLLTAFIAFNPILLRAQNEILSDLPFLLWSTIGLALVECYVNVSSPSRAPILAGVALGLVIFMAAFTRVNGLLLFVPLAAAQFMHLHRNLQEKGNARRELTDAAVPYVVFGICYGFQAVLLPSSSGGVERAFDAYSWLGLWNTVRYYALLPGVFLQDSAIGGYALYAVLLLFFVLAIGRRRRRDLPMLLYGLATIALYVITPFQAGPRYIYPILPLFFLLALQGMKVAASKLPPRHQQAGISLAYAFWAGLAAVSLAVSLTAARSNMLEGRQGSSGPYSPAASRMFSYVRNATPVDSVIVFFKPRAMRLITDRDSFLTSRCDDLLKADYVVIGRDEGSYNQIPLTSIKDCDTSASLKRVFGTANFVIYQVAQRP